MKLTNTKIIISGSTLEAFEYLDKQIAYGFTVPEKQRKSNTKIEVVDKESKRRKEESREKGMNRARSTLRRLINANAWKWEKPSGESFLPVFVTLTFAENIQDTKIANLLFSKFIKRLTYYVGGGKKSFLKYVVVTEFQKRGAIHYHAIFFNLKYVHKDDLYKLWEQGFVNIKKIGNVNNAGAYICKYMSEEFKDERLDGKKRYFSSRGLNKPTIIKNEANARSVLSQIPKKLIKFEKEFDSHVGKIKYIQYQIDKNESFIDIIPELDFYI